MKLPELVWQVWRAYRELALIRRRSGDIAKSSIKDFEEIRN